MSLHRIVEPEVHLPETWSAQLVMQAQPAPSERRQKYKEVQAGRYDMLHRWRRRAQYMSTDSPSER